MAAFTTRPVVMGTRGVVTAGHYLAAAAGFRIMEQGGNAIDAAAAMCVCLNLLEPQSCGIRRRGPHARLLREGQKVLRDQRHGLGAPGVLDRLVSGQRHRSHPRRRLPADHRSRRRRHLGAGPVPVWDHELLPGAAACDTPRRGHGFPVYQKLHDSLASSRSKYMDIYPTTGEVYFPDGRVPEVGEILRNPDFAEMLKTMCRAEEAAAGKGRIAGIEAARDAFYKGPIAERIVAFIHDNPVEDASGAAHTGMLSYDDMAEWRAELEEPVTYNYRGLDVSKCPSWTQGPVFLQQLAILEGYDLRGFGHNSADYLHTLTESAKLAFADREAYYGDPKFDDVPMDVLLSESYSAGRRELIGQRASVDMRPGDVGNGVPEYATIPVAEDNRIALGIGPREVRDLGLGHAHMGDTTHLDAVDSEGNMVAATPSGGWIGTSPVVKGLGFPMGTRGQMFYLNPARPNALAPRKRPRATLTPSLATRGGEPFMVFGTPGGDGQDQWTLQFLLNYVDFGMDLQEALDAPTVHSVHFPSSFYPRESFPGRLVAESRIPREVITALEDRGHEVMLKDPWSNGKVLGIRFDPDRGVISGAASPKGNIGYTIAW